MTCEDDEPLTAHTCNGCPAGAACSHEATKKPPMFSDTDMHKLIRDRIDFRLSDPEAANKKRE